MKKLTVFQAHCTRWASGCGSEFCAHARNKTFYRGQVPCDILFVGEAPGRSEDAIGKPFIGPAGRLLDSIITRSIPKHRKHEIKLIGAEGETDYCPHCKKEEFALKEPCLEYRIGFTNVVICIPRREGDEKIEPEAEQIESCKPRLEEIIKIAAPKMIVTVGTVSRDALLPGYLHSPKLPAGVRLVHIVHPAWLLRQMTAFQGLEVQKVEYVLRDAIKELEKGSTVNTQPGNSAIMGSVDYSDDIPF